MLSGWQEWRTKEATYAWSHHWSFRFQRSTHDSVFFFVLEWIMLCGMYILQFLDVEGFLIYGGPS